MKGGKRMKRTYTVSKDEKSGLWYAHKVDFSWIPVLGSFSKSKRVAQRVAADCMALPLKEYLQLK
jgi:hypothetical protein